jgi:Tfp pilus assembly protein PilN
MRINLLPPEVLERQRARRRTVAAFGVGLLVLVLIAGFYFLQVFRLSAVEDDVQAQRAENALLESQIAELQDIAALEDEIDRTRLVLSGLLEDRVLWSGVLRDVSLVIPGEVWLNGITAQVGIAEAGTTTTTTTTTGEPAITSGVVGQISFDGFAFDHRDVALWLSRLEDVRGFINPWLSSSTKTLIGAVDAVGFTSSVDLSEQAIARRDGSAA